MMKTLIKYFLQGLLYIVPTSLSAYIIYEAFNKLDGLLPFKEYPGLGALILLVVVTFLGFIGSTIIAQPFISYFDKVIQKAPLIKFIYSSIKDLLSAFVGDKKRFDQPVLVKIGKETGLEKIGFITRRDLSNLGIAEGKSAVYLPQSYNFSGNLFVVANDNITELDVNAADAMKFIISGGVTTVEEELN